MGLREKQTAERKSRILNVADALIRQTGGTEFSMRLLADLAEVSQATPYNLFGSKEGILSASLERSLTRTVFEGLHVQSAHPLDFVVTASGTAVDLLVTQKDLLRPLYQYLLGTVDPLHHPLHINRSVYYWRTVVETTLPHLAERQDVPLVDYDTITFMLFAHFLGLLELWVHEDIDGKMFRARAIYGALLIVMPFAPKAQLEDLNERIEQARLSLEGAMKKERLSSAKSEAKAVPKSGPRKSVKARDGVEKSATTQSD